MRSNIFILLVVITFLNSCAYSESETAGTDLIESKCWRQTDQSEFETCRLIGVDTVTHPGGVNLGKDLSGSRPYKADESTLLLMHFDNRQNPTAEDSGRKRPVSSSGRGGPALSYGRIGGAMMFNGRDSFLTVGGPSVAIDDGDATWEFWLKTEHTALRNVGILGGNNIDGGWAALVDADGRARMHITDTARNSCVVRSKTVVDDGKWHHVMVTRHGGLFTMYVDGIESSISEIRRGNGRGPVIGDIDHPGWYPMTIGRDLWCEGFFKGLLDEIRISNVVRKIDPNAPPVVSGTIISPQVNFDGETVEGVRLKWDQAVPPGSSITYSASNDGGKTWHKTTQNNTYFKFPSSNSWGDELLLKADFAKGSSDTGPVLHSWEAIYTGSGLTRYERWQKGRPFTQGAWYGDGIYGPGFGRDGKLYDKTPAVSEQPDMDVFQKAGLNMVFDNTIASGGHEYYPPVVNAQAAGVDYIFRTPGEGGPWTFKVFEDFVNRLANYPKKWTGLVGVKLADEPRENSAIFRTRRDWIVRHHPRLLTVVGDAGGSNPMIADIRSNFHMIAENIRADALVFQFYPTHWSPDGRANPVYYVALDYYRDYCKKRRIGFWSYPQTAFHDKAYSDSVLRIEKYAALAYGIQGFQDFLYDADWPFPDRDPEQGYVKVVGNTYDTTTSYPIHAAINHEIANLAKTLIRLRHVRTYHVDEPPKYEEKASEEQDAFLWSCHAFTEADDLRTGMLSSVSSASNHLMVGFFRDEQANEFFMVVNKNHAPDKTGAELAEAVTLTFADGVESVVRIDPITGEDQTLPLGADRQLTIDIRGGTGELFRLRG